MILVTGGAGYIGSHAVRALVHAGFEPVIFDNISTGHRSNTDGLPFVEGDVREPDDLYRVFSEYKIDGVLHFAGKAYVGESYELPEVYYETNLIGGLRLLDAMLEHGATRIIFSSTCATYGVPKRVPITEDHPQLPVNPYGDTKLAFERALQWYNRAHNLSYVSLRYFNAAGADASGDLGEDHDPETHLIPLTLFTAAGWRPHVEILGTDYPTPDGTCIRDYIHVTDLADAHVRALQLLSDGGLVSQAINLGTGRGASVREIIDVAGRVTGRPIKVIESARRPGDPPELVASPDRAQAVLGWKAERSDLDNIMRTAWNWHTRRRALA